MAIYGRFGDTLTVLRLASLDDVKKLGGRKPDKVDKAALESGSYVVCRDQDGSECLYHQGYMQADGGSREITEAIASVTSAVDPAVNPVEI